MNKIVRAWKDETYRQSLSAEEQAMLLANPAGEIELTDAELEAISGASGVSQAVSQHAVATFGNGNVISGSVVVGIARNIFNAHNNTKSSINSIHSCKVH
ncbi:MAG TPA: mersacidin/lichenicidin family type 2 lantibiotic [Ktedonobacteraceae bacterium]|jgi:mersacidin/lichenicidin family type 2 lantibiotic